MISIALIGACGRMGLEITRAASGRSDVRIGGAVEAESSPHLGRDLGEVAGIAALGAIVDGSLESAVDQADVVVDLSLPQATESVVSAARAAKKPLVCGTTGLGNYVVALFNKASKEIPVLYTTNLSPGIAVMAALVERAARALGEGYDVEIVEMHHRSKVDAPSGTALTLAGAAARAHGLDLGQTLRAGRAGQTGERSREEIGVHAVRGGGIFGEHTCILAGEHERLEITHRAASRSLFAQGALKAALFLADKKPGRYTMSEVLGF